MDAEVAPPPTPTDSDGITYVQDPPKHGGVRETPASDPPSPTPQSSAKRYHGAVKLDPTRVGRDASQVADEVIAHLAGLLGADVKLTLEIEANIPDGAPEQVVRIVTANSRTLNFDDSGFETE